MVPTWVVAHVRPMYHVTVDQNQLDWISNDLDIKAFV